MKTVNTHTIAQRFNTNGKEVKRLLSKLGVKPTRTITTAKTTRIEWPISAVEAIAQHKAARLAPPQVRIPDGPLEAAPFDLDEPEQIEGAASPATPPADVLASIQVLDAKIDALTAKLDHLCLTWGVTDPDVPRDD